MKVNEIAKTGIFIAGAALAVLIAWAASWTQPSFQPENEVGKPLFVDPKDASKSISLVDAASLEVVAYNEKTATVSTIRFQKVDGKWLLASHDDYPTDPDAKPVDKAIAALFDLRILGVESDNLGDQARYGVVDPGAEETRKELKTGVGTRVTVKDAEENVLVDLVIGKKVEDESLGPAARRDGDQGPRELHYVRRPEHNRIYTVAVNTEQKNEQGEEAETFSTAFDGWIAQDLMGKFDGYALKQMLIQACEMVSVTEHIGPLLVSIPVPMPVSYIELKYEDYKWQLAKMRTYQGRDPEGKPIWDTATELAEKEELSVPTPYELGEKLKGLTIVDIQQKPEALSKVLEAEGENALAPDGAVTVNPQFLEPLNRVGFDIPQQDQQEQLYGEGGSLRYLTNEGVEYTLRFSGAFTDIAEAMAGRARKQKPKPEKTEAKAANGDQPGEAEKTGAEKKDTKESQQRRFLLVTTRFVQDAIPKPEIKPVPEITAEEKPEQKAEAKPVDQPPAGKKAPDAKPAKEQPTGQSADPASAGEASAAQAEEAPKPDNKPRPAQPAEPAQPKPAEEPKPGEKPEPKPGKKPEAKPSAKPGAGEPAAKKEPEKKVTKEDVDKIVKENEDAQKRYDEKVEKGKQLVKDLNARYAKWFYIVPEDDYQDVFLTRDEIVKEKEKVEPKPAVPGEGEPAAKPETEPEPSPKAEPEPKEQPAPKAEPKEGPAPKTEPAAKPEPAPKAEPEAKPEIKPEAKPESKEDSGPNPERPNPLRTEGKEGQKP